MKAPRVAGPYAVLTVESPSLKLRAMISVVHRLDFRNLWEIYEQRRVAAEEEVLLGYMPYAGFLGPLLRPFLPRLHLLIYPKGALEFFSDPKGRPPPLIAERRPPWWH